MHFIFKFYFRQQKLRQIAHIKQALEEQMKTKFEHEEQDKIQERLEDNQALVNTATQLQYDIQERKAQNEISKKVFNDAWNEQSKMTNYIKIADETFQN